MENIHGLVITKLLVLLATANGTPVLVRWLLKHRVDAPLDFGWRMPDGRPLLGPSKTIRGLISAIAATTLVAPLLSLPVAMGGIIGAAAMLGDLISSFIKRRLGLPPSSMALGLDQIPESLLPLVVSWQYLALSPADGIVILAAFLAGELALSRVLYRLHVRDRPY